MKVIFSHNTPFSLGHGGVQVQIESLMQAIARRGVEVEPERWWDSSQCGDILHFIARPNGLHAQLARRRGYKVVMTDIIDATGSRTKRQLMIQRFMIRLTPKVFPHLVGRLGWDVYRTADALVFQMPQDKRVAEYLFKVEAPLVRVIGHGVSAEDLAELARPQVEEDYLVSVATIDPRKNALLLADAAHRAAVPVLFLGKPYSEEDSYYRMFLSRVDGRYVRHAGHLVGQEKIARLRGARGFVLLSRYESGCIAVYEAAAAGLPLLLPDLPWARYYPAKDGISFVPHLTVDAAAGALAAFYREAHRRQTPVFPVSSWDDIAGQYLEVYRQVMGSPA